MDRATFGDDLVEIAQDGTRVLTSAVSKGWVARKPATLTSAEHPGTAVAWPDEWVFEVTAMAPLPDGRVRYTLAPWESRHTIRVLAVYDAATEEARSAELSDRVSAVRKRRLSILFAPVLGHLPGCVQERMESEFGAPALGMTVASALPLLVSGVVGVLAAQIAQLGGEDVFPSWLTPPLPLAVYLTLESAFRLYSAWLVGEPMGSLAGSLYLRGVADTARPAGRQDPVPGKVISDSRADPPRPLQDARAASGASLA